MSIRTQVVRRGIKTYLATILALLLLCCVSAPFRALAQDSGATVPAPQGQLLKPQELEALVASIALYPDALLAGVLMASTYPLEIVRAERWVAENKNLKGDQLKAAVDKQAWDGSVKALVATPSVLTMMNDKLDWTQKLGDAVLAQQADVMDAIQRLRAKAQANKKLESTKEQKVSVRREQDKDVIVIEPAVPETLYVPYYDPAVVFGGWPYPEYPPYYFGAPGYIPGGLIATGIAFGAGYALGRWTSGGNYWGGGVNWGNRNLVVNRPVNINNIGNNWQHNPVHRQGVRYNNSNVQQRFGNSNLRSGSQQRMDFRGRSGEQVLKPGGGGRADLGDRARPGGGERGSRVERPGGGERARPAQRPTRAGGGRPARDTAFSHGGSGRVAQAQSMRGRASMGGGGGAAMRGGGGGGRMGGGGGARGGGGGRRSDIALKHDIVLLGYLSDGLGFYRFSYNGSERAYVGVIAQEVRRTRPDAVIRGRDGYLRVYYDKLGLKFETYRHWIASGGAIPELRPQ